MANRDSKGRFVQGNQAAKGHSSHPTLYRRLTMVDSFFWHVQPSDIGDITEKLIELAKGGDLMAIKLVLERMLGRPDMIGEIEPPLTISIKLPKGLEDL